MGKSKFNKMACPSALSSGPQSDDQTQDVCPLAVATSTRRAAYSGVDEGGDVHGTTGHGIERGDVAETATKPTCELQEKQTGEVETAEPADTGSSRSPLSRSTELAEEDDNLQAILLSLLRQEQAAGADCLTEKAATEAHEALTRASTDIALPEDLPEAPELIEMDAPPEEDMQEAPDWVSGVPDVDADTGAEVTFMAGTADGGAVDSIPQERELCAGSIESLPVIEQTVYALHPAQSAAVSSTMPPPPPYQAPMPMQPVQFTNCYSGGPSIIPPSPWPGHDAVQSAQAMLGISYPARGSFVKDASWHLAWCADYYKSQEHVRIKAEIHEAVNAKGGVVVPFWTPRALIKWLNTRADVPYAMLTDVEVLDTFVKAIASSGKNRPLRKPVHIFVFRYSADASDALRHLPSFHQKGTSVQFNEAGFRELASQCVLLVLGLR